MTIRVQLTRFCDQVCYTGRPLPRKGGLWDVANKVVAAALYIFAYAFLKFIAYYPDKIKFPISNKALELQAEWQRALREGKAWAREQKWVSNFCHNGAYFTADAKREKLIWDLAVLLGLEEHFAPSGLAEIKVKSLLSRGTLSEFAWKGNDLVKLENTQEGARGVLQYLPKGCRLRDCRAELSDEEVARAIFISVVFGMYGANRENIWVADPGKIQFCNEKCFPETNGVFDTSDTLAYKCALLDLPQSAKPLTLDFCKDIQALRSKLGGLGRLLNEKASSALRERLDRLEAAFRQGKVTTAQDLVAAVYPEYKHNFALAALVAPSGSQIHNQIGLYSIAELQLKTKQYLTTVKSWCDDPGVSLPDLHEKIQTLKQAEERQVQEKRAKEAEELKKIREAERKAAKEAEEKIREAERKAAKEAEEKIREAERKAAKEAEELKKREAEAEKIVSAARKRDKIAQEIKENAWIAGFNITSDQEKRLVEQHLSPVERILIMSQARQYPIMAMALEKGRQWLERAALKNLAKLSQILASIPNKQGLFSLGLPKALDAFAKGGENTQVVEILICEMNKSVPKPAINPITQTAIEKQAELHKAMRESKGWARRQASLKKFKDNTTNDVFALSAHNEPSRVAAFFKVNEMEKLIWDLAVLFGLESSFAATGVCRLKTKNDLTGGNEKEFFWQGDELKINKGSKIGMCGTIQPALKGNLCTEPKAPFVSREQVARAVFISILFGMYDLHGHNFIISPNGTIQFFDNSRTLPNSNSFILYGNIIILPYRSALLEFHKVMEPLSDSEKGDLRQEIVKIKGKMNEVVSFLNWPKTQAKLAGFPPGWFDPEGGFLIALQERLNRLESAFAQGRVKTAEDLVMAAYPDYKLVIALEALNNPRADVHNGLGLTSLPQYLAKLQMVNLAKVKEWCDDPKVTITDLLLKLKQTPLKVSRPDLITLNNLQKLWQNPVPEFKDINRARCELFTTQYNEKALSSLPRVLNQNLTVELFRQLRAPCLIQIDKNGNRFIMYSEKGKIVHQPLNISIYPGKVKVGGQIVSIKQLLSKK